MHRTMFALRLMLCAAVVSALSSAVLCREIQVTIRHHEVFEVKPLARDEKLEELVTKLGRTFKTSKLSYEDEEGVR